MNRFISFVSSQFGNPNGVFGRIITSIQNIANRAMYTNVLKYVEVGANDKYLDIGYGNGYLLQKVFKKTGCDMYGIDISADARDMAIKKNKKAEAAGKLHLDVGDCCDLTYGDEVFAAVTTINTVYFWSDTVKGLSEIRRVLKPGCSFYNVVYTKEFLDKVAYTKVGFKKFEPEELVQYGKDAGFEKIEIKEIKKGKSFVVIYTR